MATGVYSYAATDLNVLGTPDGVVNFSFSGSFTIVKLSDGGDNHDADVLDIGDTFEVISPQNSFDGLIFTYEGTDGSGGVIGHASNYGDIWLSDTEIFVNDPVPSPEPGDTTICFAGGTLIATPEGEQAVETLAIGALVTTADGRAVPVKWIGRQTVHKLFTPAERLVPVRVRAGALGEGLPHTDLLLTADHALIIDGIAINAGALVNGTTIAYDPIESLADRVTYYHIETAAHDVILANGTPAETYVDYIGRRAFDNYAEYLALYGEERSITEMHRPRVSAARLVPPVIRARLNGMLAA